MVTLSNKSQIHAFSAALKEKYGDEAEFVSKSGFPFNAFDDEWKLDGLGGTGQKISWSWMHEVGYSDDDFVFIRMLFSDKARTNQAVGINNRVCLLKRLRCRITDIDEFKRSFPTVSESDQTSLVGLVSWLKEENEERFKELYEWTRKRSPSLKFQGYDPIKGAYSIIEQQSILARLNDRLNEFQTSVLYRKTNAQEGTVGELTQFSFILANILLAALLRRQSQLIQLKWNDLIPIGATFSDSRIHVKNEYDFSDVDQFQIRMYKAKTGAGFRDHVELYPLLLNQKLSKAVLIYRNEYQHRLLICLKEQGIFLSDEESMEIINRCPVFYHASLFKTVFKDKQQLFSAINIDGQGFHLQSNTLRTSLTYSLKNVAFKSDRIPSSKLRFTNNRNRHTALCNGAIQGLDEVQLSKITNVTPRCVKSYIDFSHEARVMIDTKFNKNKMLQGAFLLTVSELKLRPRFAIKDEFDQEIGSITIHDRCSNCTIQMAKPIGCYGCDNFTAMRDADHQSQLEKALFKLQINEDAEESSEVLQKLRTQIFWIEATISRCEELREQAKGISC